MTGLNYLSLTNLMNPSMLRSEIDGKTLSVDDRMDMSKIYFRVETYDDSTVRETADIIASGYSGDTKQTLKVNINRDSYMPVFNFSLYSTYKTKEDDEGGSNAFYKGENAIKLPE